MVISLKQFTGENKKFDTLRAQAGDAYTGPVPHVDFSKLVKPTELEPLEIQDNSKGGIVATVQKDEETVASRASRGGGNENVNTQPTFAVPSALTSYLGNLIQSGRKLKVLAFDIDFTTSNDEIRNLIEAEQAKGVITDEEKGEMFSFLKDSKLETEKY